MKKFITLLLILVSVLMVATPASAQKKKKKKKKAKSETPIKNDDMWSDLQGKWQSLDDKNSFFIIRNYEQWNFYQDKIIDTTQYGFYKECPEQFTKEGQNAKSGNYFVTYQKEHDISCYKITKINPDELVMTYLPRGNALRYKKVYLQKSGR